MQEVFVVGLYNTNDRMNEYGLVGCVCCVFVCVCVVMFSIPVVW